MKRLVIAGIVAMAFTVANQVIAQNSSGTSDIDYQIMVQRATQAVIWAMPAAGAEE